MSTSNETRTLLLANSDEKPSKVGLVTITYTALTTDEKNPVCTRSSDSSRVTLPLNLGCTLTTQGKMALYIGAWDPLYPDEAFILFFGSHGEGSNERPFCFRITASALKLLVQNKDPLIPSVVTALGTKAIRLGSYFLVPIGEWGSLLTAEGLIIPDDSHPTEHPEFNLMGAASTLNINGQILHDVEVEEGDDTEPLIVSGEVTLDGTDVTVTLETPHLIVEANSLVENQDQPKVEEEPETAETGGS